ncbi:MAG: hypothetical protein ACJ72S_14200 [Nitrososphaeraceae archaeon]
MMVVLASDMKELMAVFQKMHGMDHDIRRPTKATFVAAKRKYALSFIEIHKANLLNIIVVQRCS